METIKKSESRRSWAYKLFVYVLPSVVAFIVFIGVIVFAGFAWLALRLGAPAPGADVISALTYSDADRSLKLALAYKRKQERIAFFSKNNEMPLATDLLSSAYELNEDFEKSYEELKVCTHYKDHRYRSAYLAYRTGRLQEAFDDYIEITRDYTGEKYDKADSGVQKEIRLAAWSYITANANSSLFEFEKQSFPFDNAQDFYGFMERMQSQNESSGAYEEEMKFWHDLCLDFDAQTTEEDVHTEESADANSNWNHPQTGMEIAFVRQDTRQFGLQRDSPSFIARRRDSDGSWFQTSPFPFA